MRIAARPLAGHPPNSNPRNDPASSAMLWNGVLLRPFS